MKLIKLIRAGSEHTMFGEGIMGMEFIYNNDFILHLWSNVPPEQIFAVSSENTAFYEKIVEGENAGHLIFDKKGYIHFQRKMTPSPKKCSCAPKFFSLFSPKMLLFSNKFLSEKIFKTSFPIKKVIFIFIAERSLPSITVVLPFSRKIVFFEKTAK